MTAKKQSKTDAILLYLVERANEPVGLSEMSSDLGFDRKVTASIAGRLASKGFIKKVKRGTYVFREKSTVKKSEIEVVCHSLSESIKKTFGGSLMKKLGIELPLKKCTTASELEGILFRLKGALGSKATKDLISVVIQTELPRKSGQNLMRKLDI